MKGRHMGSELPIHLSSTRSQRGFKHMPALYDSDDDVLIRLYESSAAFGAHIWLNLTLAGSDNSHVSLVGDSSVNISAHLTLELAAQVRDQLTFLIENHYQVVSDAE